MAVAFLHHVPQIYNKYHIFWQDRASTGTLFDDKVLSALSIYMLLFIHLIFSECFFILQTVFIVSKHLYMHFSLDKAIYSMCSFLKLIHSSLVSTGGVIKIIQLMFHENPHAK